MGKAEGKRPPARPRHRWEDNIKMDVQDVGCWGIDWIELAIFYYLTCTGSHSPVYYILTPA